MNMAVATSKGPWAHEFVTVNGVKVEVLTAGKGQPLVFWHGAGTIGGWDFAVPWTEKFKVIIPYHPGWGGSDDAPKMTTIQDYVMLHLELLDILGLDKINLVGMSMGGWMASTFASQQSHRLNKLVLVAPAGLRVPEAPTVDLFKVKNEEILGWLVESIDVLVPYLPATPDDLDFITERYRESASFAKLAWEKNYDLKLPNWLHRIKAPTLLVWGKEDKVVPLGQASVWSKLIPNAVLRTFSPAGHLVLNERPEAVNAITEFLL